jgi:hypothetical protein
MRSKVWRWEAALFFRPRGAQAGAASRSLTKILDEAAEIEAIFSKHDSPKEDCSWHRDEN